MKADARCHGDSATAKTTSPPHLQDDSVSDIAPPRKSAQPRGSAVDPATVTSRVPLLTLELMYPHGKDNLIEKEDFMENMLTKTHEVPPKSTPLIPELVLTIPQLCMKPLTTRNMSEHHTAPLPITETSMDMHGMDGLSAARQKQPTRKKIVRPQFETMMEVETTMIGTGAKRSLHALSRKSVTSAEDRQKRSKIIDDVGSPTALMVEAVIQPRRAQ